MDSYYRLRRLSPLSASLPDVTGSQAGFVNEADFLFSPTKSAAADYNIDDDTWADKTDPKTGSVFHVQAAQNFNAFGIASTHILRSNSSSSLSSNPSMTDLAPPSPTVPFQSFPERFSQSLQLSSPTKQGEPLKDYFKSTDSKSVPKPKSIRKKIKKAVLKAGRGKSLSRHNHTASLSDLHELYGESHTPVLPSYSETPTVGNVPQATLHGSRGIPLKSYSFHSSRSSVIKIHINVKASPTNSHAKCSLETLGIVPVRSLTKGKFGSLTSLKIKSKSPSSSVKAQPLVVRGVVPGTVAAKTQRLQPGDSILRVNEHSVSLENIDAVLAGVQNELSLVVKRYSHGSTSPTHSVSPSPGGLVRLVTGGRSAIKSYADSFSHCPHMLLYLTMDTEEDDPVEKEVFYKFPPDEMQCNKNDLLFQLKGVFLTLSDVLGTITSSSKSCSTIVLDYELVHISYMQYGKEVLMLALPGNIVSQYQVQLMIESIAETVQLLFGNVKRAFTNADNYPTLDHILSLLFDNLLAEEQSDSAFFGISAVAKLNVPTEIAVKLSFALSGLESADHNSRPEILHIRRPFTVLGSCLMYRGALACKHMPGSVLQNVVKFCNSYRLLEITASDSISQIVIWKEVHLSELDPDFPSDRRRTFILVVGLEHVLLCMIMEHTTLTLRHDVSSSLPTVDAVYVDRGRTLLLELKAQDVLTECETRGIRSAPVPSLVSIDNILKSLPSSQTTTPKRKKLSDASRTKSLSKLDDGSDSDSSYDGNVENLHGSPLGERQRSRSLLNVQLRTPIKSRKKVQYIISPGSDQILQTKPRSSRAMYSLTAGPSNILLQYISISQGMGLIVCPIHTKALQPMQMEVIQSFRKACLLIREVLQGRANMDCVTDTDSDEEIDQDSKTDVAVSSFASRRSQYFEHGVLLQCVPFLTYWVVGRLLSEQELYVCYQENTAQDLIEMAFRLLFGCIV